jgi:hypothetical protein
MVSFPLISGFEFAEVNGISRHFKKKKKQRRLVETGLRVSLNGHVILLFVVHKPPARTGWQALSQKQSQNSLTSLNILWNNTNYQETMYNCDETGITRNRSLGQLQLKEAGNKQEQ